MDRERFEDKFLDYTEGILAPEEAKAFEEVLRSDAELRRSFEEYSKVAKAEKLLAGKEFSLHPNFAVKVMNEIEVYEKGWQWRLSSMWSDWKRAILPVAATLTALVLVVKVTLDAPSMMEDRSAPDEANLAVGIASESRPAEAPKIAAPIEGAAGKETDKKRRPIEESSVVGPVVPPPATVGKSQGAARVIVEDDGALEAFGYDTDDISSPAPKPAEKQAPVQAAKIQGQTQNPNTMGAGGYSGQRDLEGSANQLRALESSPSMEISDGARSRDLIEGFKQEIQQKPKVKDGQDKEIKQEIDSHRQVEERTAKVFRGTLERFGEAEQKFAMVGEVLGKAEADLGSTTPPSSLSRYQPAPSDEQYKGYEENSRLNVSESPSSTFSIDVDTASYTNARRFLKAGNFPPRDSIRIEEFINYFDYDYPTQYEKPFSLSYEIAPSPLEPDRYLLKLGIKARDIKEESKPWNLVFLVDVSGSMSDSNKLPLVQRALRMVVSRMRERDKIGIVTYAGTAGVALESSGINDKSKILGAIDGLTAGGSTNGSGGIEAAYSLAERNRIDGGVNRVILATDGDFNVGVTDFSELLKLIENKRKGGVNLTTLGFGFGNLKDGTLEQLANKGNGNYFYIDSFQEARKVLDKDLLGTLEVVAKDVKLQVEFNPAHVANYRLVGYENRRLKREDFNNDAVDAGEIGSGHTVTSFYELVLADSPLAKKLADEYRYQSESEKARKLVSPDQHTSEVGFLKIRFKEPDGNESKLLEFPIESGQIKRSVEEASADFRFAAAVSYFAHLLRGSTYSGNYTYSQVLELAQNARGEDKEGYRQEFIEIVKNAIAMAH